MAAAGEERCPGSPQLGAEALGGRRCSSPEETTLEVRWGPACRDSSCLLRHTAEPVGLDRARRVFSPDPDPSRSKLALYGCRTGVQRKEECYCVLGLR